MWGKITKIDRLKQSRNPDEIFMRVYFHLEDGSWAKTDIVPTFRNYKHWKPYLKKNVILFNLRKKADDTIDADSYPSPQRWPDLGPEEEKARREYEMAFSRY